MNNQKKALKEIMKPNLPFLGLLSIFLTTISPAQTEWQAPQHTMPEFDQEAHFAEKEKVGLHAYELIQTQDLMDIEAFFDKRDEESLKVLHRYLDGG